MGKAAQKVKVSFEEIWLKPHFPLSAQELLHILTSMRKELCKAMPSFNARLECFFVSDAQIEDLNQSFLGAPGPTNTLAFESFSDQEGSAAAQIFFSVPQYQREYILYGQKPESYAVYLLAHAMSHLPGLEHGAEMDNLSEKLEEAGMRQVGSLIP